MSATKISIYTALPQADHQTLQGKISRVVDVFGKLLFLRAIKMAEDGCTIAQVIDFQVEAQAAHEGFNEARFWQFNRICRKLGKQDLMVDQASPRGESSLDESDLGSVVVRFGRDPKIRKAHKREILTAPCDIWVDQVLKKAKNQMAEKIGFGKVRATFSHPMEPPTLPDIVAPLLSVIEMGNHIEFREDGTQVWTGKPDEDPLREIDVRGADAGGLRRGDRLQYFLDRVRARLGRSD
jgi:hypothetical protein